MKVVSQLACTLVLICTCLLTGNQAVAQTVKVTVENLQPADGLFLTPFWAAFHDGSFDTFSPGAVASTELEALAEEGMTGGLSSAFSGSGVDGTITSPGGFPGAPVFDPGETASMEFTLSGERYFSYASMVIPSNDAFVGNGNPTAYEVYDGSGNYNGDLVINIFGDEIWDAGTEVNDGEGAAFSNSNPSTDENGVVSLLSATDLNGLLGLNTAAGGTIGSVPAGGAALARITIQQIPEPASAGLLCLASTMFVRRRRS